MSNGILFEAAKAKKAKRKDAPEYWRTVNGQHVGFDGNPPQGRPVIGSSKLTKYLMVPKDEAVDYGDDAQDVVAESGATHYMKVKNPKTGNMNKIGFADSGRAVSGDPDLVKSINAKRSGDVAGAKSTIKALDRHNQSAARKGAPTRDNAYGVDKKDLAKAWKTRRKNWNEPTASDAIGLRHSSDDSESQTNAIRLSRKSDDAVSDLIQNKIKLKQMHGGMNRGKGVLGRLARKVKTFLKPGTLADKDI